MSDHPGPMREALVKPLEGEGSFVRRSAAEALGRLRGATGHPDAMETLVHLPAQGDHATQQGMYPPHSWPPCVDNLF